MFFRIVVRALLSTFLVIALASTAAAQNTANGDVAFGWGPTVSGDYNLTKGWFFSFSKPVREAVSVVVDAQGQYGSFENTDFGIEINMDGKLHGFMGGVRFTPPTTNQRAVFFVQAVAGIVALSADFEIEDFGTLSVSETKFGFMPGVGVDVRLNDRMSLRLAADYRIVPLGDVTVEGSGISETADAGTAKELRLAVGLSFPIGR